MAATSSRSAEGCRSAIGAIAGELVAKLSGWGGGVAEGGVTFGGMAAGCDLGPGTDVPIADDRSNGAGASAAGVDTLPGSGPLFRTAIHVAGSPTAKIRDAAIASWNCGLWLQPTRCFDSAAGWSATPSKRRIAASTAASRAAGLGGGGSGSKADSSSGGISKNS